MYERSETVDKLILIKYGELTTKKDNRKLFIKILKNNIKKKLANIPVNIESNNSCMYITTNEEYLDEVLNILNHVFGIHSIVVCDKVNNNIEEIYSKALEIMQK